MKKADEEDKLVCYGGGSNCGNGEGTGGDKRDGNKLAKECFPMEHRGKMNNKRDRRCYVLSEKPPLPSHEFLPSCQI